MGNYVRFSQTPQGKKFYQSAAWRKCRKKYVTDRQLTDGGLCEICRYRPGEELHHIKEVTADNVYGNIKKVQKNSSF
jgi:hypothetical protein